VSPAGRPGRRLAPGAPVLAAAVTLLLGATVVLLGGAALATPAAAATPPRLTVRAAALYAPATGQTLYANHAQDELAIASTTKLMTALITLEHVHTLGKVFTQNDYMPAAVDSQIGLVPGERMSVHDLLIALMLPSADDAAEDLAYNVGHGSVPRFVAMMNQRARQLGLRHTHYATPSGLDTPGNHSSASDLNRLAAYDLHHSPFFARVVALAHAVLYSGSHVRNVINRNTLVREYPWIDGVKTGHTSAAGYVLVASGHRDRMRLVSSVLGTTSETTRDANTLTLLDWGFANFRLRTPVREGEVVARATVTDQPALHPVLVAARGFSRILDRADRVTARVRAPRVVTGPLSRRTALGSVTVLVNGRPVGQIPLLLARAVPAVSALTLAGRFLTRPLTLVLILLVAGGLVALALGARQRRRTRDASRELEAA
jgi:D-alanyl-D-alanine carboxypeptidase (penicillin-binding protein 5/6)